VLESIVSAALTAVGMSLVAGALLGVAVLIVVRNLALSAAARHALWLLTLVATALMPPAAFGVSVLHAVTAPATLSAPLGTQPAANRATTATLPPPTAPAALTAASAPGLHLPTLPKLTRVPALIIIAVWAAGALAGFIGLAASLVRVRGLKRRSSPLDGTLAGELNWLTENAAREREIYLRLSFEIETPVAIGFRRPVILVPTDLATQGGLGEIESLIMHEHAHLRRYDDWTNLGQRIIERLFWFNPLVWLLGRRIALEREIASDEAVVARTGRAKDYANSLWRLAREMRMPEHAVVAPGALLTRKQITIRIEALLSGRAPIPALGPLAAVAIAGAAALSIVAVASRAPALEVPTTPTVVAQVTPAPVSAVVADHPAKPHPAAAVPRPAPIPTPAPRANASHPRPPAGVDADSFDGAALGERIGNIVARSLAGVPGAVASALPAVAQRSLAQLARDVPEDADPATLASILRHCAGCNFAGRDLRGADLRGARLAGANLSDADLRNARLDGAVLAGVNLSNANLDGASLVNARLYGVNLADISLHGTKTTGMRLIGSAWNLANTDLRGVDVRSMLDGCTGCNLDGAKLAGADLHGISLRGSNFADADLRSVNLRGAKLDGTNFSGADLTGVDFTGASLAGCTFAGATLHHVVNMETTGATF
jgi:uncharacterized protein YjbI with pentapeptide repeats/beta-lactamase regulating signal transducer with metallopeptidase domain